MVTPTSALAAGSARQPGDAGSRWAIGVTDVAEVVESRRCREIGSASSEKLHGLVVLPSNKPLQRSPLYGKAFDGQTMVVEGSSEVRHRRAEW